MNTINKKAALCNQLNMNFEEANELFDNESLESMQMAKVNGGITVAGAVDAVCKLISAIASAIKCIHTIDSVRTIAPGAPTEGVSDTNTLTRFVEKGLQGNTSGKLTIEVDSIVGNKIYGVKYELTIPTPAPTKAQ